jgi:cell surface protein SprA
MVGVKSNETHQDLKEVWFNELRIADMDNQGDGSHISVDSNLADFATISATGKKSTIGFGALEQGPNQNVKIFNNIIS